MKATVAKNLSFESKDSLHSLRCYTGCANCAIQKIGQWSVHQWTKWTKSQIDRCLFQVRLNEVLVPKLLKALVFSLNSS